MINKKNKFFESINYKKVLIIAFIISLITFLYFSVPITVFPDSLTYYDYLRIFRGTRPIALWDLVRGPSLPLLLFVSITIVGNAMLGILSLTYLFFISLQAVYYSTLKKVFNLIKPSKNMKIVAMIIFFVAILFNPLIFGYCHALLTEFVAILFSLVSCILAWVWMKVDVIKNKIKFILIDIVFAFNFVFMWFLKQPYLSVALFPVLIACVLSVIRNHKLSNILQRFGTLIFCITCLILSINGWRSFLVANGKDLNTVSGVDNSFLSNGIIKGISNARLISEDTLNINDINNDKFLSTKDKSKIIKTIQDQKNGSLKRAHILNILSISGKRIIDKIPVYQEGPTISFSEAINTWINVLSKHPIILIDSYLANYMSITDSFPYHTDPTTGTLSPIKSFSFHGHENHSIGLLYAYYPANMDTWTRDQMQYPGLKYIKNDQKTIQKRVLAFYGMMHCGLYLVLYLFLPLVFIYAIICYKRLLKKDKKKNNNLVYVYELVIISLGFTMLHIAFHDVMGAIIDRYAFVTFPVVALSYIILVVTNKKFNTVFEKCLNKIKKLLKR